MTDRLRLDVLEIGFRWTVTDARTPTVSFSSFGEAYDAALRRAADHGTAEVHVWRHGKDDKVFETQSVSASDPDRSSKGTAGSEP